jgi:hypothetical protein
MLLWLLRLTGLTGLAADDLTLVTDALALVGFRRPHTADASGFFADGLLIDPADRDLRLAIEGI